MNRQASIRPVLVIVFALLIAGFVPASASAMSVMDATGAAAPLEEEGHGGHGAQRTLEMETSEFFMLQFNHMVPHLSVPSLGMYNVNLFQLGAIVLILVLFMMVRGSFGSARPPWIIRVFRGWVLWIRDEMVYPVMGREEGAKFAPFFIFLFFFITFMNVIGLIPSIHVGGFHYPGTTATADPYVTGALALVILAMMLGFGMAKQGAVKFWVNLLPHGLPAWLIPIMAIVEFTGVLVKPFALMVRLFANMLAGHLVIYSFIGLIFVFTKMFEASAVSYLTAVPFFGFAVFINIIETFITLLQAYIFTYLSIIFVHQAMHPDH